MEHSPLYIPSLFSRNSAKSTTEKPLLKYSKSDFLWPALFMLSMSMTGIHLYPMLLAVFGIMMRQLRENRYDFAIMAFLLFGGYSMMPFNLFPIKFADIALMAGISLAVIMRKPPIMRKTLLWYLGFVLVLLWVALQSWESMKIQFLSLRFYWAFITVFIPLAIFAGMPFDVKVFVRRFMIFATVMCIFVCFDSLVVKCHMLLPQSSWGDFDTFRTLRPHPFSLTPLRVYPQGLLFITIALIPAIKMYRLPKWIWALIILSALATFTFTYISALALTIILFVGGVKKTLKLGLGVIVFGVVLYFVDDMLPKQTNEYNMTESTLRIQSTVKQFVALSEAMDDEDVAEFGSGRMAQAIPKLELVGFYHKEWVGLGFLHQDYSSNNKFMVYNEYYTDVTKADEVATGVEIIPIQIYISGGWIALIAINLFYFGLWFFIRKLEYNEIYLSTLVFVMIMGIGGFASPSTFPGAQLLSFSYAIVILANRSKLPGFSTLDK